MSYQDVVAKNLEREAKEQDKAKGKNYTSQTEASAPKPVVDGESEQDKIAPKHPYRAPVALKTRIGSYYLLAELSCGHAMIQLSSGSPSISSQKRAEWKLWPPPTSYMWTAVDPKRTFGIAITDGISNIVQSSEYCVGHTQSPRHAKANS